MKLDPNSTAAYIVLATALAVAPGPDVLFVVANGMRHKAKGAIASALGIGCGSILHAIAAATGVSAIVAASPTAFEILKWSGAAYLLYLGIQTLRSWWAYSNRLDPKDVPVEISAWNVFRRGLITNILNPKVIVFYLALLPQFVSVSLGHVGLQIFLLGSIHNAIGLIFLLCVGFAAGRAAGWLRTTNLGKYMDGIAGLLLVGLAFHLAIFGHREP